jgi:endonuclease-3 related protein
MGRRALRPKTTKIAAFSTFWERDVSPSTCTSVSLKTFQGGSTAAVKHLVYTRNGRAAVTKGFNPEEIRKFYRTLYGAWGPQHWWPAETPFEVIVGAYLTQNTSWTNVERAMENLRRAKVLSVDGIRKLNPARLERLIQPSGYFRQKAKRLKIFVTFLDQQYEGSLERMFAQPTAKLRKELLELNGVGPETADSILLYAGNHPVFVVDAYTLRILDRHQILPEKADYEEIRLLFEQSLNRLTDEQERLDAPLESSFPGTVHPPSSMSAAHRTVLVQIYNEMHGLIVGVGKFQCGKSKPKCDGCPLQPFLSAISDK